MLKGVNSPKNITIYILLDVMMIIQSICIIVLKQKSLNPKFKHIFRVYQFN